MSGVVSLTVNLLSRKICEKCIARFTGWRTFVHCTQRIYRRIQTKKYFHLNRINSLLSHFLPGQFEGCSKIFIFLHFLRNPQIMTKSFLYLHIYENLPKQRSNNFYILIKNCDDMQCYLSHVSEFICDCVRIKRLRYVKKNIALLFNSNLKRSVMLN